MVKVKLHTRIIMKWTESSWFRCEGCLLIGLATVIILMIFIPCVIFIPLANRSWEECNITVKSCEVDIYEDDDRVVTYYSFDAELNSTHCDHIVNETIRVGGDRTMNCTLYGEKWRNEASDCYYRIDDGCDITASRPVFVLGSWETSYPSYVISIMMCVVASLLIVLYIVMHIIRRYLQNRLHKKYEIIIEYDL